MNACRSKSDAQRDHLINTAEAREHDAKEHCQYEILMAENIADGIITKCRQERESMKIGVSTAMQHLQKLQEQADEVLGFIGIGSFIGS